MTTLLTALGSGLSAKKILEYLMRKSPELAPKISSSLAAGISAEKILKFFSKGNNFEKLKSSMEEQYPLENNANPLVQASKIRGQNLANDPASQLQRAAPGILGGIGAAGAGMALNHALPNLLKGSIPEKTEKIAQNASSNPPIVPSPPISSESPAAPIIQQAAPAIPPKVKTINVAEILNKYPGIEPKINDLIKAGNTPEAIGTYFKQFNKAETKKLEKETGKPIEEIVNEYVNQNKAQKPPSVELQGRKLDISQETPIEHPKEAPIEPPKIEKGATVDSPEGVGQIKEIRGDKALIEVGGVLKKVNIDELEAPTFSDDEIADAYDNLMEKIPEEHKSGFISWAGYDDDRNVLGYIPRGGKYEELENITPEEAEIIKQGKGVARTSGETREGLWIMGEDTRGGLISQIIHDRRKKHEEIKKQQLELPFNIPKGEKLEIGMKPIFDEMRHARELSREREKKKKLEEKEQKRKEKERLLKEKNEAKKRKKQA